MFQAKQNCQILCALNLFGEKLQLLCLIWGQAELNNCCLHNKLKVAEQIRQARFDQANFSLDPSRCYSFKDILMHHLRPNSNDTCAWTSHTLATCSNSLWHCGSVAHAAAAAAAATEDFHFSEMAIDSFWPKIKWTN